MKQFLKFIVSIIVIFIMIFTAYFLIQNASKYTANISGDNIEDDINEKVNSGDVFNNSSSEEHNDNKELASGDISNSVVSGDTLISQQEIDTIINNINLLEKQNKMANVSNTVEASVGLEIMGIKNKDFFETFNLSEITVTIQTAGTMVYIIPNSDFIDNAQYHFDTNGNLILYVRELIGVGGEIRYYYSNGKFLKEEKLVEEGVSIEAEDAMEILQRANLVCEKYIK